MAPKKSQKGQVVVDNVPTEELVIEKGQFREYPLTDLSEPVYNNRTTTTFKERILIAALIFGALTVRAANLETPDSVVFDEVHFGGFAKKYIKQAFFMDVHPPLAKLLFALVAYLGGFKGNFDFKSIGDVFPPDVPYVLMRQLAAFMGVGTVLFSYFTLRASGCKPIVAFFTASLLIIENGFVTLSRYILLDSPLIFFIAGTAYFYIRFEISKAFSLDWFNNLTLASVFLGCALSSKWVGLFTIAWLGIANIFRLWFLVGDLKKSPCSIWKQIFIRVSFLLGIPAAIYIASFYVHFAILKHEGDGAAFMSSAFRLDFDDSTVAKSTFADVGISSVITLKHLNTRGGYLHSHDHLYEGGSNQQQITLYPHLDDNNKWYVELYNETMEPFEFRPITDGTKIRLRHLSTSRRLHSHDIRPAVSEVDWQNEASCYGFEGFEGDPNDDFIVEIIKDKSVPGVAQEQLRAIDTVFALRHAMTGCRLWSHERKLPKWGFEQQEVTCTGQGIEPLAYWYIEQNENIYLPLDAERIGYKPLTFWQKFTEIHKTMWQVNNGLTESHVYESRPLDWILMSRGISYWSQNPNAVYLLGNPFIWYPASFLFISFGIYVAYLILSYQLGYEITFSAQTYTYAYYTTIYLLGWILHYFPFFLMGRQLFFHHYFPALYFAILALGHSFELIYSKNYSKKTIVLGAFGIFGAIALWGFYQRKPIVYGTSWIKEVCESTKWLSGWDYNCGNYPDFNGESAKQGVDFAEAMKIGKDEL
ncbi:dolichyl-phosphate-mannose-protein mannosyltransferase [Martiniozyma asiatica (nom. inval.)]|nr:dolichyl-phosphate-mannose-protein mannosyltransferase [Martiniozyma asiatica]